MTEQPQVLYVAAAPRNGFATAALALGIVGFVLTPVPFFIGLFIGGIPDILAIIFGIIGIKRARKMSAPVGLGSGITGLILGILGFSAIFLGAGWFW